MQLIDELKTRPGFQILCRNDVYRITISKGMVSQAEIEAITQQLRDHRPEISFEVFVC